MKPKKPCFDVQKCNLIDGFLSVDKNVHTNNSNPYIFLYFYPPAFQETQMLWYSRK